MIIKEITNRPVAMISQPMANLSEEEITQIRDSAIERLEHAGYNVLDTFFTNWVDTKLRKYQGIINIPLYYLAESLISMSKCDAVFFCDGWDNARGCIIEHDVAEAYGVDILYESDDDLN